MAGDSERHLPCKKIDCIDEQKIIAKMEASNRCLWRELHGWKQKKRELQRKIDNLNSECENDEEIHGTALVLLHMDYGDGIQLNFDASMINNDNDDDLYSEPECDDTDHDSDSATTSFSDNLNDDFDAEDDDNDDAATDANDDHEMSQLHKPNTDDELTLTTQHATNIRERQPRRPR